jgi:hypothetical protein
MARNLSDETAEQRKDRLEIQAAQMRQNNSLVLKVGG